MASLFYRLFAEIKGKKLSKKHGFEIYIDQKPGNLAILFDNMMLIHEIHVFKEWTEFSVYDSRSY